MDNNGYIKIFRNIKDKGYYKKSNYVHLWLHLLLSANHTEKEFLWNGKIIKINKGQFITGRQKLSVETGIKETTIENILKLLEKERQIGQQKTTKYRLITILNWRKWQLPDNKRTTNGQQTDTNKNDKNDNKYSEQGSPLKANKKSMKKNSFRYREDLSSDTFEDVIDIDTGQQTTEVPKTNLTEKYFEIIKWAEDRRGFKFLKSHIPKQFKAFKIARENEIQPGEIKNRWIEYESDKFWKDKGFDFLDVVNSFNKKR